MHSGLVGLLDEVLGLKELPRTGWLRVGVGAPESVAAHSFGVAWLCLALCPPELDLGRCLSLAVLHDLAEIRVGDLTPHDGVGPEEKHAREAEALGALLRPLDRGPALEALWASYEAGSSPEARFVRALDKLDMGLQARRYARDGIDTAEFLASARAALDDEAQAWLRPLLDGAP